jgi:hypothetical protein
MRTAQKRVNVLQKNPKRTVLIEGFTDSTGASRSSFLMKLAERCRDDLDEMRPFTWKGLLARVMRDCRSRENCG